MKYDKILIFCLSALVCVQSFYLWKPKEVDYSYYISKVKQHQETIDSLTESINQRTHEINRIKSELIKTDSIIFDADKSKLREMSTVFK